MACVIWIGILTAIIDALDEDSKAVKYLLVVIGLSVVGFICLWFHFSKTPFDVMDLKGVDYKYANMDEIYYYDCGELKHIEKDVLFGTVKYELSDSEDYADIYVDNKPWWVNFFFFVPDDWKVEVYISDPEKYNNFYEEGTDGILFQ